MLLPDLGPPAEGVMHTELSTDCFVGERHLGNGALYIAQRYAIVYKMHNSLL